MANPKGTRPSPVHFPTSRGRDGTFGSAVSRHVSRRGEQIPPVGPLRHGLLDVGGDEVLSFPDFPSASQGAVYSHQVAGNTADSACQGVLCSQQGLLRSENRREIRASLLILDGSQIQRTFGCFGAPGQVLGVFLGAQEARQGILNLLLCQQHCVLIGNEKLLETRILQANVVGDSPVVQDIPTK